jgi:hypothetical protein
MIRAAAKVRLDIEPGDVEVVRRLSGEIEVKVRRGNATASTSFEHKGFFPVSSAHAICDELAALLGVVPRSEDSGVRAVERDALVAGGNDVQAEVLRDLVRESARRRSADRQSRYASKLEEALIRIMSAGGDIAESISDGDADDLYEALVRMGTHALDWCEALRRHGEGKRKGAAEVLA